MKYSDSVKAVLAAAIDELTSHPEEYAQKPGRDSSRNRKLGTVTEYLFRCLVQRCTNNGEKQCLIFVPGQGGGGRRSGGYGD